MITRALVPLKKLTRAKSRLADALTPEARQRLVLYMASHVLAVLRQTVDEIVMLTEEPVPAFAHVNQVHDTASGLNASLMRAAQNLAHMPGDLLIVMLPDLPVLAPPDVTALLEGAATGAAIAPDHHGTGTNAIALSAPQNFRFCFGAASRLLHQSQVPRAVLVQREGLAFDVDDWRQLHLCPPEFHAPARCEDALHGGART